ncbi:MAG: hypothetical protein RLZZ237_2905, partial [Pseudomonadota bacterium]
VATAEDALGPFAAPTPAAGTAVAHAVALVETARTAAVHAVVMPTFVLMFAAMVVGMMMLMAAMAVFCVS